MLGSNEKFSVYIVDDDEAVRDSLAVLLKAEGFIIKQFSSADEFLDEIRKNPLRGVGRACLLLDLNMPGTMGQDLLTIMSQRDERLPVVVMTGNLDEDSRKQALQSGAAAYLLKPADADDLIGALTSAVTK